MRHTDEAFNAGLGNEHPVERVVMVPGQRARNLGVTTVHRQLEKAVLFDFVDEIRITPVEPAQLP